MAVDAVNIPGFGVRGAVRGVIVEVCTSADPSRRAETGVDVVVDGTLVGRIFVADRAKPSSADAIADMKALGSRPLMATGDRRAVADVIAHEVGIDSEDVYAELSPSEKLSLIRDLQAEGRQVAMVGDGVNDAAALAAADLESRWERVQMSPFTPAISHSMRNDLTSVVDAIELSRRTLRTIKVNLLWAFGYNVAAVPLAMSGQLSPTWSLVWRWSCLVSSLSNSVASGRQHDCRYF